MSSEERYGITEPADYQCGSIDDMIALSLEATMFCKQAVVAFDPQTIVQANKEVLHRIKDFEEQLEEFRAAIEQTRLWGGDWKKMAKQLKEKYEPVVLEFDDEIPF